MLKSRQKIDSQQIANIRKAYIYSLAFMSLLTLFAVYVVTDAILQHRLDSSLINRAGKQRMLSQMIVKDVWKIHRRNLFSIEDSLVIVEELKTAFAEFSATHKRLQDGTYNSSKGENSKEVKSLLGIIHPHYQVIDTTVRQLFRQIQASKPHLKENELAQIDFHTAIFLSKMDKIVAQYVVDSEKKQLTAIYKTCGLGALFLACFLFISMYVFRPAVQNIAESVKILKESNEEIASAEEELRQQNDTLLETQNDLEQERDKVKEALAFQKAIFDNAGMIIIGVDNKGIINAFNKSAENILEYEADELIGKQQMTVFFGKDELKKQTASIGKDIGEKVEASFELFALEVIKKEHVEKEWNFKTKSGEDVPTLMNITVIRNYEHQVIGFIGVGRDITQRKKIQQKLDETLNSLQDLYDHAPIGYHSLSKDGLFLNVNQTELSWLGYTYDDLVGKRYMRDLLDEESKPIFQKTFQEFLEIGYVNNFEIKLIRKDGSIMPVLVNSTAIYDENRNYLRSRGAITNITERKKSEAIIKQQNDELQTYIENLNILNRQVEKEREKFNTLYNELKSSINYAKRIQDASLPNSNIISWFLNDFFVLFKPKDVVSGDFYWFAQRKEKIILITADCTGHGVPGAFMALIGNNLLNRIINIFGVMSPELILYELHKDIRQTLKQKDTDNRDGMDISVCVIDIEKDTLEFAGANHSFYYIQNNELQIIKGDRKSIGGMQIEEERIFTKTTIDASIPTVFYLFSDGYVDQFGGVEDRKFLSKHFRELLLQIYQKPMAEQKQLLESAFMEWKGERKQTDDVLVIGAKYNMS